MPGSFFRRLLVFAILLVGCILPASGQNRRNDSNTSGNCGAPNGGGPNSTNYDGANPIGGLILSGDTLYGTAQNGGAGGSGERTTSPRRACPPICWRRGPILARWIPSLNKPRAELSRGWRTC